MSVVTDKAHESYYVPSDSKLPIFASLGIFLTVFGMGRLLLDIKAGATDSIAAYILIGGGLVMGTTLFFWFKKVIEENHARLYSRQLNQSFVWGMGWFIFSEVMFFAAFFGALFYIRIFVIGWIGGEGNRGPSEILWPNYVPQWPLLNTPDPVQFPGAAHAMGWFGLPLVNTALLLASSVTLTIAHHGIKEDNRRKLIAWLGTTIAFGIAFLVCQVLEYKHAYTELGLTLTAGIYGTTFFMLTGFHGAHVTIGTLMLIVMFYRALGGHFTHDDCFGFEAAAWYWHFVDVVWVCLFVVVYIFGS